MPAVSVIIPTYNSADYIGDAIESVLAQTWRDLEVLVIDDGSTDATPSVVKQFASAVRYIRQSNSGVAVARNQGIKASQGQYVAFLDADDTWFSKKLEKQMGVLSEDSAVKACYSSYVKVTSDLRPLSVHRMERRARAIEDLALRGNLIGSICTVLCERRLFEIAGGFDPELSQCADWDMWLRLAIHTEFLFIDEPLVTYRQHSSNMSRNARLLERDSLRVLEKAFKMPELPEPVRSSRRAAFARNYMVLAGTYFHAGMISDCLRCAVRSVSLDLRQASYVVGFPRRRYEANQTGS